MTDLRPIAALQNVQAKRASPAWQAAEKLEASFLAEMLKNAGLGEMKSSFGGGPGEAQFASFLREQQALQMVRGGGIGLAETFYIAMKESEHAQP